MIWCAEHKASVGPDDPLDGPEDHCLRWYYDWDHPNAPILTECRMVEALLIVKENGLWKLPFAIWPRGASIQTILDRIADPIASAGAETG